MKEPKFPAGAVVEAVSLTSLVEDAAFWFRKMEAIELIRVIGLGKHTQHCVIGVTGSPADSWAGASITVPVFRTPSLLGMPALKLGDLHYLLWDVCSEVARAKSLQTSMRIQVRSF